MSQNFSQRLKDLREQHGYTQDALASELYVSRQAISQWENGKSSPDVDKLVALAQLYSISVDELLGAAPVSPVDKDSAKKVPSSTATKYRNPSILEQFALAVILVMSFQVPFLSLFLGILTLLWIKRTNRNYPIIMLLSIAAILAGCFTSYRFISYFLSD